MTRRQLNVAVEVAERMPAAHLAQLQAELDDPDNRCPWCGRFICGPAAAAVILQDADLSVLRLGHPECKRSGIYEYPGLRAAMAQLTSDGLDINASVGRRHGRAPRALVLIELLMHFSPAPASGDLTDTTDPLADYAAALGLQPISGQLDQITPTTTTTSHLHVAGDTLSLIHPDGQDVILDDDPTTLTAWSETAAADHAIAIVITARGLGLNQQPTTVIEAIATRPAFAAQVTVTGLPRRQRWWRNPLARP